ncbi:2Fe-2S iron-sulfur cluster binding domain-containing protein [Mucilaginibacter pallidiroseus]|uniref:2Fe-2S iron-sulfur cluster binding domain-containing protein n=1 Tax=Mucilaginibacter pallidiroseus TaxID=2599295 RepID=A0A563UHY4_9SPHI|nr:2Fe-2S iron-sulfur cluster-binding protein [Mucilaginibacter pallidiroseus]TWR30926.1 2Fe-2S iron-sulfur cluster binding domain-containing protein [Mucilaginibacter pallidiroseus]
MIDIKVETANGSHLELKIDSDENRSLMEILSTHDIGMLAACGGLALCGTCHIMFKSGGDNLPPPTKDELAMLEMLPGAGANSRLSCQVMLSKKLNSSNIKVMPID